MREDLLAARTQIADASLLSRGARVAIRHDAYRHASVTRGRAGGPVAQRAFTVGPRCRRRHRRRRLRRRQI